MRHTAAAVLLLFAACTSSPQQDERWTRAVTMLKTVGDAALRVKGYAALEKYAKAAIPLIDLDGDRVVTLAEVVAAGDLLLNDPELAAGLLAAAYALRG